MGNKSKYKGKPYAKLVLFIANGGEEVWVWCSTHKRAKSACGCA